MDKLDKNKVLKPNKNNDYERNSISEGFNSISKLENQELINKQINSSSNLDQQSMHKVNLAAALHDHISCTKLQTDLSRTEDGLLTLSLNLNSNKTKEIENEDLEDDENFSLGFNEQDFALKEIIMGQLDLIQHQQEQLLKKERQLQSIKQDREQMLKKIDNMEKEIHNLKDQLLKKEENKLIKKQTNEQFIDINKDASELCLTGTGGESLTFCNFLTDPSNLLTSSNVFSTQTTDQQLQKVTLINKSPIVNASQTAIANKSSENETEKMEVEISINKKSNEDKKRKKSNKEKADSLTDQNKEDKKKESSSKKKSLSNKKTVEKPSVVNSKETKKLTSDKQKSNQLNNLVNNTSVADNEPQQVYLQLPIKTIETDNPYELVTNRDYFNSLDEDNDLDINDLQAKASFQSNIEIPSWRLHQVSCSYSLEGTENVSDEVFLRRHSKLELDEKRRKRWDCQRLRERLNNEKLRSRYSANSKLINTNLNSSASSNSQTVNNDNQNEISDTSSFYPNPNILKYIEVSDSLPVIAFGQPIPELKPSHLKLPWQTK